MSSVLCIILAAAIGPPETREAATATIRQLGGDVCYAEGVDSLQARGPCRNSIHFNGEAFRDEHMRLLRFFPTLRALTLLDTSVSPTGLQELSQCRTLEYLELSGAISDQHLEHVAHIRTLRAFKVCSDEVTDEGLVRIAELPNVNTITLLGCQVSRRGLASLAGIPTLHDLELHVPSSLSDDDLKAFAGKRGLTSLMLTLHVITDSTLKPISDIPDLQKISLIGRIDSAEGFRHLARLSKLRSLDVSGTQMTPEAIRLLTGCLSLRELDLGRVDDVRFVDAIASLRCIESVFIISPRHFETALRAKRPKLKIRNFYVGDFPSTPPFRAIK